MKGDKQCAQKKEIQPDQNEETGERRPRRQAAVQGEKERRNSRLFRSKLMLIIQLL